MSNTDIKKLIFEIVVGPSIGVSDQCGLVKGASGSLLLLMQEYKSSLNNKLLNKIHKQVNQLIDGWDHNYTLGYGITGLAWTLEVLKKEGLDFDNFDEWSDEIDKLIVREARKMLFVGNFDFFNGASGLVSYLLSKQSACLNSESIFHDYIYNLNYYKDKKSSFYYKEMDTDLYVKNLGVPHGITGIILILLLIYDSGYLKDQTRELIESFIDELIRCMCQDNRVFQLGSTLCVDNNYTTRSVLAWCYGDLMAGYAIHKAGLLLENFIWQSKGIEILEKSTLRSDIHEDCLVLCHGLPSLFIIYKRIYKTTNDVKYLQIANKWKLQCEKEILGGKNDSLEKVLKNPSLFQGFSGLLLSFHDDFNAWEKCLLL